MTASAAAIAAHLDLDGVAIQCYFHLIWHSDGLLPNATQMRLDLEHMRPLLPASCCAKHQSLACETAARERHPGDCGSRTPRGCRLCTDPLPMIPFIEICLRQTRTALTCGMAVPAGPVGAQFEAASELLQAAGVV